MYTYIHFNLERFSFSILHAVCMELISVAIHDNSIIIGIYKWKSKSCKHVMCHIVRASCIIVATMSCTHVILTLLVWRNINKNRKSTLLLMTHNNIISLSPYNHNDWRLGNYGATGEAIWTCTLYNAVPVSTDSSECYNRLQQSANDNSYAYMSSSCI